MNFTGNELELAKRWMLSLLSRASAIKNNKRNYFKRYVDPDDAKDLCDEIKYRNFTFFTKKLDDCLTAIAKIRIETPAGGAARRSAEWCAEVIAWFCETNGIVWDDSNKTKYEIDAIKDTTLGKALFEHGCFLHSKPQPQATQAAQSQPAPAQSKSASTQSQSAQTSASSQSNSTTTQTGKQPVSNYKHSGGHSKDIPNLVGAAGQKIYLNGPVYCITADKTGKNTPRAFITPLSVAGNNIRTVNSAQAEKIKFGSGNGYTDCTLFFDSLADARAYEAACKTTFGSKFNNIHVETNKNADKNGYFRVKTELNDYAYIKASVLNEELEEKLNNMSQEKTEHINDIDVYNEWMQKSIS